MISGLNLKLSVFFSLFRILATFGIFLFHILGLYGLDQHNIDFTSILVFCFLSGYFSDNIKKEPLDWIYKRSLSIMVPYWIVIIPALILNRIAMYKDTSLLKDVITVLGGNLFLEDPVYVIAWYVTFIMLLYVFVFFQSVFKNRMVRLIIWGGGYLYFAFVLNKQYYFYLFALGFLLAKCIPPPSKNIVFANGLAKALFIIQDNCYAFFLIHGGILLMLFKLFKFPYAYTFVLGIIISMIGAIILRKITKTIVSIAPLINQNV